MKMMLKKKKEGVTPISVSILAKMEFDFFILFFFTMIYFKQKKKIFR